MNYIDGFVVAVPTAKKEIYRKFARKVAPVFREYGALRLVECWGNDVPDGEVTSFPMAVKCLDDETVVFSWIEWPSKAVRDVGMQKVMDDPRVSASNVPPPFDGQRMIFGGFEIIVDE